ncbi:hypothetical protein LuPra_02477 [Luteitalea pratensis]|uniref:Uncharacterized protein n=1 Tax=Luteitalea pratensis TaxID=1855912 RepID=A0A143PNC7_LUTPR|nr:hypothetical protein [Luteitalea pratensis]AMY09264.1 hypothetical protein LuPra_02477 [Luteitalea pratensis]
MTPGAAGTARTNSCLRSGRPKVRAATTEISTNALRLEVVGGRRLFDNEILNLDNWLLIEVIHDARQIDVIRPRID